MNDPSYLETAKEEGIFEGVVREDRRRLIAMPTERDDALLKSVGTLFGVGDGKPNFSVEEVIAVRGEHLALTRLRVEYPNGDAIESLRLFQIAQDPTELSGSMIVFDVDDVDSAHAELDTLYEVETSSP